MSILQVLETADDLNLLTLDELRAATGVATGSTTQLSALGARVSAMITSMCNVASDGVNPPTLMREGCKETIRLQQSVSKLVLARRPVAAISTLTEAGSTLTLDTDFEVDPASGQVTRLRGDHPCLWVCGKIVVEYQAGFEDVPDDLKALAAQLAGGYWADSGVDPMEKSLKIPDLIEIERWVDASADPQMPKDILNALIAGGYVNRSMVL